MQETSLLERAIAAIAARGLSHFGRYRLDLSPADLRALKISFSQFGEDLVIAEHLLNLRRPKRGIYVDAGCFDPVKFSNTRLLHLLGWRGINIDACPEAIRRFEKERPGDINLCAALAGSEETNEFIETESGASSRLARGAAPLRQGAGIRGRTQVTTQTLRALIDASSLSDQAVDFLDIDCEGIDFEVLKGFDLTSRKPVLICIEAHGEEERNRLMSYLGGRGYRFLCDRGPSLLFREESTLS